MQQLNDPFRLSAPVMSTPGPASHGRFTYQQPHRWRRVPRALPENSRKQSAGSGEVGKRVGREWGGGGGAVTQRGGRRRWNLNVLKPGGGRKKQQHHNCHHLLSREGGCGSSYSSFIFSQRRSFTRSHSCALFSFAM